MANEHGGYRRPASPAAVSGPGALSARTDGAPHKMNVTDLPYGEAGAFAQMQSAAPLSAPAPTPYNPQTLLTDPSVHPNQPVTAGADSGPGPSAADIGLGPEHTQELRAKFGPLLPVLMRMADSQYATTAFKRQVRQLIAQIQ